MEKIEFNGIVMEVEETHQAGKNPQKMTDIEEIDGDKQIYLFDNGKVFKRNMKVKVTVVALTDSDKKPAQITEKCYDCGRILTKGNKSATRFHGHPLCRKCAKFP